MLKAFVICASAASIYSTTARADIQLPPAFLDRKITTNTYADISAAISLLELDDFLEVVLVGNFSDDDAASLSTILEDASLYSTVRPLRAHIYEKKIYRVSIASRVLAEKVAAAVRGNDPSSVSETLTGYHSRLGVSTTLFVIGIEERQEWTLPQSASSCLTIVNMRAPGAAWIYLNTWILGTEFTAQSMPQYFDGFSDAHAYEVASTVQTASYLLMPFPSAHIALPSATKEFIFLEISFCDSYTRSDSCPGDTIVMDTLRALDGWLGKNDQVVVSIQSLSFNIHDHPELLYALHAASNYVGIDQQSSALDLELLLYHVSKFGAVRRAVSSAADSEGRNRDHSRFKVIPVFNFQLNGQLGYYARGSAVQTLTLSRWQENDHSLDYPSAEGVDIAAVVRLRSHSKAWEDLFTLGEPSPCGRVKLSSWLWNGNIIFESLVRIAWGVELSSPRGIMEVSVDAGNEEEIMMPKNQLTNDFRIGRSVDRSIIISRLENLLASLHSLILAYSVLPSTGMASVGHGTMQKNFSPDLKYYDDVNELLNTEIAQSNAIDIFVNFLSLANKVAVEFSHLNYNDCKHHLYSMELLLQKLRKVFDLAASKIIEQKKIVLHWNNSIDGADVEANLILDEDEISIIPSLHVLIIGFLSGFLVFFLAKVVSILVTRPVTNNADLFRRHASRSVQKRIH